LQVLGYMIDVYRGRIEASRNLANFALFVAFFPKLLAGPIERASNLLRQIESSRPMTSAAVYQGLWLILLGYFQKLVIADNMRLYTDPIFAQPESSVGLKVPVALYAFAFQIYGDFAGYSNIARGVSQLLGFDLMLNFRQPYLARNPADFWERWHMSFSTWMRDYVYVPLGGNRAGTLITYRNVLLVMLLAGLWHRAAWNFLAWGAFHAVLLIGYRLLQPALAAIAPQKQFLARLWKFTTLVVFFHFVCFGWMLFAVRKLSDVPLLLTGMFSPFVVNELNGVLTILLLGLPLLWIERSEPMIPEWSRAARLALYAGMFAMIVVSGAAETYEFIYFQF
jgi:alginate O-acetyltransferase complex protein AlgI